MDFLTDWLTNWLKELLIGGIMGNLEGLFDTVNTQVGEIAAQVGTTPAAWHAGVFSLIRQLSETVILPIAGMVLTFVATYELIQMLLEKNNMHEVDVANLYKWMFKTACAILILSNTFNIRQVNSVRDETEYPTAQCKSTVRLVRLCPATRWGVKVNLRFVEGCREEYPGTVSESEHNPVHFLKTFQKFV